MRSMDLMPVLVLQGDLLIEYSQTAKWLPRYLEEIICVNGAPGVFKHRGTSFDEADPMQVGIMAALSKHPARSKWHVAQIRLVIDAVPL